MYVYIYHVMFLNAKLVILVITFKLVIFILFNLFVHTLRMFIKH